MLIFFAEIFRAAERNMEIPTKVKEPTMFLKKIMAKWFFLNKAGKYYSKP